MSRGQALRMVKLAYVAAVVLALAWYIARLDVAAYPWAAWFGSPGPYAFVLGWALMATVLGFGWSRILRLHLHLALPASEWLRLQAAAWLGRYLPGKLGLFAGKMALRDRHDVSLPALGFTVLYEQIAFIAVGAALALCMPASVFVGSVWSEAWNAVTGLRVVVAVLICISVVPVMHVAGRRLLRLPRHPLHLRTWSLCLSYLVAHVAAGTGLYFCLVGLSGETQGPSLPYAIGLLAAANIAGIAAVFAPAGLGVREAVLVAGLAPWLPVDAAVITAAMLRVLSVLGDVVFCAVALSLARMLGGRDGA